jgi:hypothetical protein
MADLSHMKFQLCTEPQKPLRPEFWSSKSIHYLTLEDYGLVAEDRDKMVWLKDF